MAKRKHNTPSLVDRTEIRVRFSEVDSMQIVWHGEYARYFEDGREAFGRKFAGLGYMEMYGAGYVVPLVNLNIDFKLPLECGDTAIVETRYIGCETAKIVFEYTVYRASDMRVAAEGQTTQVFLNRDGMRLELTCPDFYVEWKKRWGIL